MRTRPSLLEPMCSLGVVLLLGYGLSHLPIGVAIYVVVFSAAGLVSVPDDRRRAKLARIRKALTICGYTMKDAAATAKMDLSDFSRMLSPEHPGKLDWWRFEMLGDEFERTYALLTLRDLDLPEFARCALKIQPAVQSMKESA